MSLIQKVGQLALYTAISIALVAGILVLAARGVDPDQFHIWFSFAFFTAILGFVLIKMYWSVRKSTKVCLLLALFMTAHIVGYIFLLRYIQQWPSLLYVLTGPVEVMIFAIIAKIWLDLLPPKVKL